uniref:Uncharacterized protein n=1 Tax=Myotis myotis TaxID=51298 RepID=A0A7J7XHS0_MYOMY|nr:hypothetical protein mMyoMyo1_011811 [Myotis myotis]
MLFKSRRCAVGVTVSEAVQSQGFLLKLYFYMASPIVSCHCSGLAAGRGTSPKLKCMKLLEVLEALEEESGCIGRKSSTPYPPDSATGDFADEDSVMKMAGKAPSCPAVFCMPLLCLRTTAWVGGGEELQQLAMKKQRAVVEPQRIWAQRDMRPDFSH